METVLMIARLIVRVDLWVASAILLAGLFSSMGLYREEYRIGMLADGVNTFMQMVVGHRFSTWQKVGIVSTFALSWVACDFLSLKGDFLVLTAIYIVYYIALSRGPVNSGKKKDSTC